MRAPRLTLSANAPSEPAASRPLLWTAEDVARELQCSTRSVRRLPIPRVRLGGMVRFYPADVLAYVEARRPRPAAS